MDWTLVAQLTLLFVLFTVVAGFFARRLYRHDSNRIAQHLNLKISFFGRVRGLYQNTEITIEPRNPIKIMVRYKPTQVSPAIMDVNMWLLRKGLPLPADASPAFDSSRNPQKVTDLDAIFDRTIDVWSHPAELAHAVFAHKQKLGSRVAKSNLAQIELNWLFPGISCHTDLDVRGVDVKLLQRNLDLVVELAELFRIQSNAYLTTTETAQQQVV